MKPTMLAGVVLVFLLSLAVHPFAQGRVLRVLDEWEGELVRAAGCGDKHCVLHQQQESNPGCPACAALHCDDWCWDHLDETCEDGPPDDCDGDYVYQTFSRTCNSCSISLQQCPTDDLLCICNDEGDYNEGGDVRKCY